MSVSGRKCEIANGRFVAFKLQKPSLAEWPLWRKMAGRLDANESVGPSSSSVALPIIIPKVIRAERP